MWEREREIKNRVKEREKMGELRRYAVRISIGTCRKNQDMCPGKASK